MFQIGDYIVYGTSGVCRVEKIGPVDLPDVSKDKLYYTLSPVRNPGGHIYTPVDNQRVVMRPILTEDETEQLMKALPDIIEWFRGQGYTFCTVEQLAELQSGGE